MAAAASVPGFSLPKIFDNPSGWGPTVVPEQFKDTPYQPYSKSDRLGKAADAFTGATFQARRGGNKYGSQYTAVQDLYGYYHDDESAFQLVDTVKTQRQLFRKGKWQSRMNRREVNKAREDRRMAGTQSMSKVQKARERDRERKWQRKNVGRRDRVLIKREPSVEVRPSWQVVEEIEFSRLTKLACDPDDPKDLLTCGAVAQYDRSFDKLTTKAPRPLQATRRSFHHVTTTMDPHIRKFVGQGNVFATDAILATLMTTTRSVYSWDIVVERVKDKLFFDKRDDSEIDTLTVNETANEPPQEDFEHPNSAFNLAREATRINEDFSQQCLRPELQRFGEPHPFAQPGEEPASVGYRYRSWAISDSLTLVARTELDAVLEKDEYVTIRALNEWDPKASGSMDWRQRLDAQRGAVFATELKNNNCKLAKWTTSALLAGSSSLRLGYVSRTAVADPQNHVILGTQSYKPKEFSSQISLSQANCWGIFKYICDVCMRLDEGKYVILKDPMKPMIRIYRVPDDAFENDDEEESDDEYRESSALVE
eukprot:m.226756 g.226756  ORF g.226756 m.226756 type:complete len:538 (-) comp17028_c0_seq1:135-1748(-)